MKLVVIPLIEDITCCNCFSPCFFFDTPWCLDLFGFLNRDEFQHRLTEINNHVRNYPLMTRRARRALLWMCAFGCVVCGIAASAIKILSGVSFLFFLGFFVARYFIDQVARRRAEAFDTAMNALFAQYNAMENPTANWTLEWRVVFTHYKIKTHFDGGVKGEIVPKFAEAVEIVLEINDFLADLTGKTVKVNLVNAPTVNEGVHMNLMSSTPMNEVAPNYTQATYRQPLMGPV